MMPPPPQCKTTLPYRRCVGVMLLNQRGEIFIAKRIDNEAGESWQMPQGGMKEEESPKDTALRELQEETGIHPERVEFLAENKDWVSYDLPDQWIGKVLQGYRGQTQRWFVMRMLGNDSDINLLTAEPEFSEWKWIKPEQLLDIVIPFKHDVYKQLLEEFQEIIDV